MVEEMLRTRRSMKQTKQKWSRDVNRSGQPGSNPINPGQPGFYKPIWSNPGPIRSIGRLTRSDPGRPLILVSSYNLIKKAATVQDEISSKVKHLYKTILIRHSGVKSGRSDLQPWCMILRAERWNSVQLAHCGRDVAAPIEVASFTIRSVRCSTPKSAMTSESNDVEIYF
jgi:hypothetical protein